MWDQAPARGVAMAIRLREVDGHLVALCAARSVPKPGDVYLDDSAHHALSVKFSSDFAEMGFMAPFGMRGGDHPDDVARAIVELEESNNANRDEWERTFGLHRPEGSLAAAG